MSGLAFLKNVSLQSNSVVKTPAARAKSVSDKNPTNADLRIFKNGAVYPSVALVGLFSLQYVAKNCEEKGNGFDVFKSTAFLNTKHWPAEHKVIFIASVPKSEPKVDLFGATVYDENDQPKSDVLTQGAVTAGVEILEMIKEVYGLEIKEGESFIDLVIMKDVPFNTDDNIYFIPKTVSRGEKKGQTTLIRREDLTLFPLVPASLVQGENTPAAEEETVTELPEDEVAIEENPIQGEDAIIAPAGAASALAEMEAEDDGTVEEPADLPADLASELQDDAGDEHSIEEDDEEFILPTDEDDTLEV